MANDPVIEYSVRDILTKMDGKLDAIGVQLATKADTSRVDSMATAYNDLSARIDRIEDFQKETLTKATARLANRQWLIPTACGGVIALVELLQALHIHLG